jgi:hypothetical protein
MRRKTAGCFVFGVGYDVDTFLLDSLAQGIQHQLLRAAG